jgi:hypothetical protein
MTEAFERGYQPAEATPNYVAWLMELVESEARKVSPGLHNTQ